MGDAGGGLRVTLGPRSQTRADTPEFVSPRPQAAHGGLGAHFLIRHKGGHQGPAHEVGTDAPLSLGGVRGEDRVRSQRAHRGADGHRSRVAAPWTWAKARAAGRLRTPPQRQWREPSAGRTRRPGGPRPLNSGRAGTTAQQPQAGRPPTTAPGPPLAQRLSNQQLSCPRPRPSLSPRASAPTILPGPGGGGVPGRALTSALPGSFERSWPPGQKKHQRRPMAGREEPARGAGPAPPRWKEMPARPLVRGTCHSSLRPVGRRLAVIGPAQARNVTREKSEWGPQQQVVILGVRRREFCFPVPAGRAARSSRLSRLRVKRGGRAGPGAGVRPDPGARRAARLHRWPPHRRIPGNVRGHEPAGLSQRLGAARATGAKGQRPAELRFGEGR